MLGELLDDDGADHAAEGAEAVGDAHEDGGVAGGDVQVVHVEACGRGGGMTSGGRGHRHLIKS